MEAVVHRKAPRRRRRVPFGPALVALLALVALAAVLLPFGSPVGEGPLADGVELRWHSLTGSGAPVLPGQFLAASVSTPRLTGSQAAVIDSIELVRPEQAEGLTVRYALATEGNGGAARGWPPPGGTVPVEGGRVPVGRNATIWVGAASRALGTWELMNFRLRYHIGSRRYETVIHQSVTVRVVERCAACASFGQPTDQL